jgi:hypothetical protein
MIVINQKTKSLPSSYSFLFPGDEIQEWDLRWEQGDNPGLAAQGFQQGWVEVPCIEIGEIVQEKNAYIRPS